MSLLSRLFLLFVGVPLLELFILVRMGQLVGFWPTVGLVVVTGMAGAAMARLEGLRTLWAIQGDLARGKLPGGPLLDGLAILLGGGLLLTPGILTDLLGFSFLLPFSRRILLKGIRKRLEGQIRAGTIRVTHMGGFSGGPFTSGAYREERPGSAGEIVIETPQVRETLSGDDVGQRPSSENKD